METWRYVKKMQWSAPQCTLCITGTGTISVPGTVCISLWHRTVCITGTGIGTVLLALLALAPHCTVCITGIALFVSNITQCSAQLARQCLLLQYIAASAGVTQISILLSMAMAWHSQ